MFTAFSVGLTGGVGSGKSTIATMLSACGAAIIDADAIAHQLTNTGGAAIEALRESFGSRGDCRRRLIGPRAYAHPCFLRPSPRARGSNRCCTR